MTRPLVELIADGACKGNPGPGGWGALLRCRGEERELCGGEMQTTNNRMELMAVIQGLEALTVPCEVAITVDSQYVARGAQEWMPNWKARGWRDVKNPDLWQRLEAAMEPHQITWRWVRGHTGHRDNERADQLANRGVATLLSYAA